MADKSIPLGPAWRLGPYVIATDQGNWERDGLICEPFAIGPTQGTFQKPYALTHLPTGRAVAAEGCIALVRLANVLLTGVPRAVLDSASPTEEPDFAVWKRLMAEQPVEHSRWGHRGVVPK
jgi:hypothetical protein